VRVDELASLAAKAELRDVRSELNRAQVQIQQLSDFVKLQAQQMTEAMSANLALNRSISLDLSSSRDMMCNIQLTQILSLPCMDRLPSSSEVIRHNMLMKGNKFRESGFMGMFLTYQGNFISDINRAKLVPIDIDDAIHSFIDIKTLWAFGSSKHWKPNPSLIDITRSLVYQALQINPKALTHGHNPITIFHFREAANEFDWIQILKRALRGLPLVSIVLDSNLFFRAVDRGGYQPRQWSEWLSQILVGEKMQLLVICKCVDIEYLVRSASPRQSS